VIGTQAVDEQAVRLHLVQRGGAWAGAVPPSPFLAVPNVKPPINGQCSEIV